MDATSAIKTVSAPLAELPVFIAGSACAAEQYQKPDAYDDCDIFCSNEQSLFVAVTRLLTYGATFAPRHDRVWSRWMRFGFKKWHTNSIRLELGGIKVNVVYKLVEGHPTTSLSQVVESFDFGLLGMGYDMMTGHHHDFRSALFPMFNVNGPLPLMPNKRANWRGGFISQYNGLREGLRYAKYYNYGYDLSLVQKDLVEGYYNAAAYLTQRDDPDKQLLGKIYENLAARIETNDLDAITEGGAELINMDALDAIMEALE